MGPVAVAINANLTTIHGYQKGEVELEGRGLVENPVFSRRCPAEGHNSRIC